MFTNQTPNYGLPQYTSPDELNVLVDFNGAMSEIDTQMKSNELAAQDAKNTAVSANNKADANTLSIQTLNSDINDPATGVGPRVTALEGHVNTIDSLIGNGVPTVGDDTLIGGINANAASIGDLTNLTTTDKSSLVAAINEVAQGGGGGGEPVDADDVSYSNTQSGLTASNVQDAIDELASAPTVKATSSGATFGDHVASLTSAWNALSSKDKYKAFIEFNTGGIAKLNNVTDGTFSIVDIEVGTLKVTASLIDLVNGKYYYVAGGTTFGDLTASAIPSGFTMKLVV